MSDDKQAARRRLLQPLTDEEAKGIHLVTRAEVQAALAKVEREQRRYGRVL